MFNEIEGGGSGGEDPPVEQGGLGSRRPPNDHYENILRPGLQSGLGLPGYNLPALVRFLPS